MKIKKEDMKEFESITDEAFVYLELINCASDIKQDNKLKEFDNFLTKCTGNSKGYILNMVKELVEINFDPLNEKRKQACILSSLCILLSLVEKYYKEQKSNNPLI